MITIRENIPLASYTTFKIGGPAKYFTEAKTEAEIIEAIKWAKEKNLPVFVLGGGSNLLVSDSGFNGLVLRIANYELRITDYAILCGAGTLLAKVVDEVARAELAGLEWAVGIPGTAGGAVCGNAGAYGSSTSDVVQSVKVLDTTNFKTHVLERSDCGFVYRGSCFSAKGGFASGEKNKIILEVMFGLKPGNKEDILKTMKEIIETRKGKLPTLPSAGSFFENYKLRKNFKEDPLIEKFPELLEKARSGKIGVGYLIDQCGLKGERAGGAMVSNEHCNFIVNAGNAKAEDVIKLAELVEEKIFSRYGFKMKREVQFIDF